LHISLLLLLFYFLSLPKLIFGDIRFVVAVVVVSFVFGPAWAPTAQRPLSDVSIITDPTHRFLLVVTDTVDIVTLWTGDDCESFALGLTKQISAIGH